MPEEEDIRKAYLYLGLEAGTELPEVMTKYKRSAMVWHPDRMPNDPKAREEATEELKKFNWARDVLKAHFEGGRHSSTGPCICRPANFDGTGHRRNTGPGRRAKTTEETNREEAQAKAKNEERARRAAGEQSTQQDKAQTEQAAAQAMQDAMNYEQTLNDNRLRWRIALGLAAAYIGLCIFGYVGTGIKAWWHTFSFQWERDHAPKQEQTQRVSQPLPLLQVSPYDQPPSTNYATSQPPQDLAQQRRDDEAKKKHDQDIYFAKLDVDRYQRSIEHGQTLIPDLETQIANPNISNVDRHKLETYRDFQQKELTKNIENLKYAQSHLRELETATDVPKP